MVLEARDLASSLLRNAQEEVLKAAGLDSLEPCGTEDELGPRSPGWLVPSQAMQENGASWGGRRLDAHFYSPAAQFAVANIKKCGSEVKTVGEVAERVQMGPRFKRNYVEAAHGVPFLSGRNIVQIRPTGLNYLSNHQMAEMQELLVKRGWTLITCSGTIGRTCFVWGNYEDYAASQHILRVIPAESKIDPGYLYAFLSSRYGYLQILRFRHGSVIDEVTDRQLEQVLVPCPSRKEQTAIGDKVRQAYDKRAEAIRLEDEAQAILMKELTKVEGTTGV
jgi:type I restriction enzyme, S subunit